MTPEETKSLVLAVLSTQSPGYLVHPDASAFVAVGLENPGGVEAVLLELQADGHAQEHEDVVTVPADTEGDAPVESVQDSGWLPTEAGMAAVDVSVLVPEEIATEVAGVEAQSVPIQAP